jgi:hypothetical protein
MQTDIWMTFSNSMHFSDKLLYKILFISSYGLKDMNFARCKYLQEFQKNETEKLEGCWSGPEPDWRRIATVARQRWAERFGWLRPSGHQI